jgi:hypothetical protein
MKKLVAFLIVQAFGCVITFGANPRWQVCGTPMPPQPNLNVRWQCLTNEVPPVVWVYRVLPNRFSRQVLSNLASLCSAEGNKEENTNGVTWQSAEGSRKLSVSFASGAIRYETAERIYGPTNLSVGVPTMNQMPELATNVLVKLGIPLSDVTDYRGASKFHLSEQETLYFVGNTTVTNTRYRAFSFVRSVEEISISNGDGGGIHFGEHGMVSEMSISWHHLERIKSFPTYSAETVVRLLREGRAFQGLVPGNVSGLYWPSVKAVTITRAKPWYCSGKSDLLYPFLALTATIETDEGKFSMEIDSPMIDEAQSLE